MEKFLTCKNASAKFENGWYLSCSRRGVPCVIVRRKNKYAEVHWDCASIGIVSDARFGSRAAELADALRDLYRRYRPERSHWEFHAHCGEIDRLTPADAEVVAKEICNLLTNSLVA